MSKYKIPMRRICNYVIEVEAKDLHEAIIKADEEFNFAIQKINPNTIKTEFIKDDFILKDGKLLKHKDKYVFLTNPETDNYRNI